MTAINAAIRGLQDVSSLFYQRGWAFGTSGNFSVVLSREPLRLLVTASGRDKRSLADTDFVVVNAEGMPAPDGQVVPSSTMTATSSEDKGVQQDTGLKPSAETMLHAVLADAAGAGSVLHVHSSWNTLLSDRYFVKGELRIGGYEMLKGLAGITTHETTERIPIFDNTQDIPALAQKVRERLAEQSDDVIHAFLIRAHGVYTWGKDLAEARRHVEILEFLFEVVGRRLMLDAAH